MTKTGRYEATWIPGLDHDIDVDESLAVGFRWLAEAERMHGGRGIIVMYAKQMMGNRPLLGQAAGRWEFVSPRSRSQSGWPGGRGPVLAIWPPNDQTLELAEQLAFGSALCVISGFNYDISPWVRRTGARGLVEGFSSTDAPDLPEDVKESLDHMLSFGGHNSFLGAGAKEDAIRRLREIARRRDRPTREAIEEHLRASVETDGDGAQRAGKWYEEILEGKRHLDYRRRTI